jgi:hypothetical protein
VVVKTPNWLHKLSHGIVTRASRKLPGSADNRIAPSPLVARAVCVTPRLPVRLGEQAPVGACRAPPHSCAQWARLSNKPHTLQATMALSWSLSLMMPHV